VSSTPVAIAVASLLSTVSSDKVMFIGSFLTIIVILLFFTRAALKETPYWSKSAERAFYAFAIPISAVFLVVIGGRIALAFAGR
jgi:hypothetical protein